MKFCDFILIQVPVLFVLKITIPLVDIEKPNHNWNKYLIAINLLIDPVFVLFAIGCKLYDIFMT